MLIHLSVLGQWQKVFNILLTKEIEGTVILDIDRKVNLDLTIEDLLPPELKGA